MRSCAARGRTASRRRALWRSLSDALAPVLARTGLVTVEAKLLADTVILGADTLSDVTASVRSAPGAPLRRPLRSRPPGPQPAKRRRGDLETGAAAKFDGTIDFSSEDFALLRQWASPGPPHFAADLAALGDALATAASAAGDVEAPRSDFRVETSRSRSTDRPSTARSLSRARSAPIRAGFTWIC